MASVLGASHGGFIVMEKSWRLLAPGWPSLSDTCLRRLHCPGLQRSVEPGLRPCSVRLPPLPTAMLPRRRPPPRLRR